MRNSRRDIIVTVGLLAAAALTLRSGLRAREPVPLAIKGFDPVAYFTLGQPARGHPDIAYEWDEHRYHFASAGHREMFRSDPVRFAPQFANFCAMALSRGEIIEANPEYWLIDDGRLYLFGAAAGPSVFQGSVKANAARAEHNRGLLNRP